jgi:NADH:ubiquinone oxidoreductase subunit 3 (subunit A)
MSTHSYFYQYLFVGIFFVFALIFAVIPLALAWFLAPRKPSVDKQATYECGLAAQGDPWIQYHVQYYLFALIFVIFDIETVFYLPVGRGFQKTRPVRLRGNGHLHRDPRLRPHLRLEEKNARVGVIPLRSGRN